MKSYQIQMRIHMLAVTFVFIRFFNFFQFLLKLPCRVGSVGSRRRKVHEHLNHDISCHSMTQKSGPGKHSVLRDGRMVEHAIFHEIYTTITFSGRDSSGLEEIIA